MQTEDLIESHITIDEFRKLRLEEKVDNLMIEFLQHRTIVESHLKDYQESDKKELQELIQLKEKGKGIFLVVSLGAGAIWTALNTDIKNLFIK